MSKRESQQTTDPQTSMSMWKKTTTGEGSSQGWPRPRAPKPEEGGWGMMGSSGGTGGCSTVTS